MTVALGRRFPGAVVSELELVEIVEGTNSRARVLLRYAAGGGPERVFVKREGKLLHRLALIALGALASEALLFESGISLPLEHALPLAAGFDRLRQRTVVVMEDVTLRRGRPNDATTPLGVEQVRSGLTGLARLHAAHWERPLPAQLRFVEPWKLNRAWAPISRANLAHGLRRLREQGDAGLAPDAGSAGQLHAETAGQLHAETTGLLHAGSAGLLERQFRASATLAATGPQTLLHGDPHPGNTYALPGQLTGFYDWQLVRSGNWAHDVGYFLVSSLDVAERRAHERELLQGYLDALGASGATPPSLRTAWESYRATPAFGLCTWLHTFSIASFQPDAVCLATIARFAAAYIDLETNAAPALAHLVGTR